MSKSDSISFRTEYQAISNVRQINHSDKILTIGSCFSQAIGHKFESYKFDVLANPFGTVYNPVSIFNLLTESSIDVDGFVELNESVFHFDFHSEIRARERKTLETILKTKKEEVNQYLKSANWLIVTMGTAHVYEHLKTGRIVANCHKVPQKEFDKRLLGMKEMAISLDSFVEKIKLINPNLSVIFTVSPVRHIKDGMSENQLSKSMLRVLCDFGASTYDHVHYFPSYEIMMDDLRDYRFYKNDLIHPTDLAEDYIWNKFQESYFSQQTRKIIKDWSKILTALAHKPFNQSSVNHQSFLKNQLCKLEEFSEYFNVSREKTQFESQINS